MSDLVFEFDGGVALADLAALKEINLPVVSVFLTGRPLWVNAHINRSDAFVCGLVARHAKGPALPMFLAGDENGAPLHDFTGTLSFFLAIRRAR